MRVWIVNPYGTLPSEGWREYRSLLLARALAEHGHEVTWWISSFEHRSKSYRGHGKLSDPLLPAGVRVIGVNSTPYHRNISLQRIRYEISYGREFARMAESETPPDVIVMGDPALFFGAPVLRYRERVGCKLILDVIDLWPELFTVALPKVLQPLGHLIFSPLYTRRRNLVRHCDGVAAVSQDYLKVALQGQTIRIPSLVAYLGIDVEKLRSLPLNYVLDAQLRKFRANHALVAVYAGTLGDAYDMDLLIEAVAKVAQQGHGIAFVIAGDGPRKSDIEACAKKYPHHLIFLGALPSDDLKTLYKNADVGLMTYVSGSTVAMPVKFFDYIAGGLAVINSLERDVDFIISENKLGQNYIASDVSDFLRLLRHYVDNKQELAAAKSNSETIAFDFDCRRQHELYSEFIEHVCGGERSRD